MSNTFAFCEQCRKKVNYSVFEKYVKKEFHGVECEYLNKTACCNECNEELWVEELHDFNLNSLYEAYRKQSHTLSLEQMNEILECYDIKKRPFSLAIGLGEITFTNYLDGDLPSRANAELLYHVYNSPAFYKDLLEHNKDLISTIAYEKSLAAVNKLLSSNSECNTKIEKFASYIITKSGDITPLQLQKLLYYIQALYIIYFNKYAFTDDCEAWQHGPVYKDIYEKYKEFRYESISQNSEDLPALSQEEKQIADTVINIFGFYSGKILERFTHFEMPWLKTREGLSPDSSSTRIIRKKLLSEYFTNVKTEYKLVSLADIKKYADSLATMART